MRERVEQHFGEDDLPGPQSDRGPQGWKSAVSPESEDGIQFEDVDMMTERQSLESVGRHEKREALRWLSEVDEVLHLRLCRASCHSIAVGWAMRAFLLAQQVPC